jgi:hypothetical protein
MKRPAPVMKIYVAMYWLVCAFLVQLIAYSRGYWMPPWQSNMLWMATLMGAGFMLVWSINDLEKAHMRSEREVAPDSQEPVDE